MRQLLHQQALQTYCVARFKRHPSHRGGKIKASIATLKRARPYVSNRALRVMAQAYVQPFVHYCNLVYAPFCLADELRKIDALQYRAASLVVGRRDVMDRWQALHAMGWLSFANSARASAVVMVRRCLDESVPAGLLDKFVPLTRPTRASTSRQLREPRCRTRCLQMAFRSFGAVSWNLLPASLHNHGVVALKPAAKKHFRATEIPHLAGL
jgi:hypothetical protein